MATGTKVGAGALFAVLALAAPLSIASVGARERASSPSAVLARADATLATQGVDFRPRPEVAEGADKTLAPYFYVDGADPEADRLPLKETSADVQIAGVIARVRIRQVFENGGSKPIEAVYVFPGSTRAAVHGMRMKIGERTIEAKIDRKEQARRTYEQARQQGQRASLLEQQRPNVFTMNVANVMPRDRIEVELDYSELLVPEESVYEFVFPTVVGPRYGGGADPVKDTWIANPYLTEGKPEPYRFDLTAHVETAIPIKELASPSHRVTVNYLSPSSADVRLQQPGGGNKDFVLRYRLAGDAIESGLLLYQGEKENFFVVMMEPPRRPTLQQIPQREYIFLLDVSGSMHGFPLDTAKELMRNLLGQMRSTDYFNIVTFSGAAQTYRAGGSVPATSGNVQDAIEAIGRMRGGGGTELMGGLQMAYAIPRLNDRLSRSVVVVTDGFVGVEAQAFKFIREHLNEANLFSFGIGTSVNRGLVEGMARAGQGEPFVVLRPDRAAAEAKRLRDYIEQPVLANIRVSFDGFDAVEVAPARLHDLLARRPLVLFGKFRGSPRGTVTVRGYSGTGAILQTLPVEAKAVQAANAPIRWLWARKWVELLDDELALSRAKEVEESITDLGLTYTLLTRFTSFVAVDSEVANKSGTVDTVNQALPLPEGVSNDAVGGVASKAMTQRSAGALSAYGAARAPPAAAAPMREKASLDFNGAALAPAEAAPQVWVQPMKLEAKAKAEQSERGQRAALTVRVERSEGLVGDLAGLVKAVEAKLQKLACAGPKGTMKLRLVVDGAGKVMRVVVVSATDASLGQCVAAGLENLTSGAKASGAEGVLAVEVVRQ